MKLLTTFNKRQLRNAEHVQLHANVRNVINSVTVAKMGLNQQLVDNYIAAIAAEQDIVNKAAASIYTKEMEEVNELRTLLFSRIRTKLSLCSIEDQSSAAYKARFTVEKNLLSKYLASVVNKLAYQEKTAVYNGFVLDCRAVLTTEQIDDIRIDADLDDLQASNQKFDNLYQSRVAEKASVEAELSLKLRAATDDTYTRIALSLNAMANDIDSANATKAEACASAIDLINVVIDDARKRLVSRLKRGGESGEGSGSGTNAGSGTESGADAGSGSGSGSGSTTGSGSGSGSGSSTGSGSGSGTGTGSGSGSGSGSGGNKDNGADDIFM